MRQRTTIDETLSVPGRTVSRTPREHPVLALQRTAGNRAVNALIARRRGEPGDEELLPEEDAVGAQAARHLGVDLSGVRVHEGPASDQLGAMAYTRGEDLHFAPGGDEFEFLGHELAHVRQQRY